MRFDDNNALLWQAARQEMRAKIPPRTTGPAPQPSENSAALQATFLQHAALGGNLLFLQHLVENVLFEAQALARHRPRYAKNASSFLAAAQVCRMALWRNFRVNMIWSSEAAQPGKEAFYLPVFARQLFVNHGIDMGLLSRLEIRTWFSCHTSIR